MGLKLIPVEHRFSKAISATVLRLFLLFVSYSIFLYNTIIKKYKFEKWIKLGFHRLPVEVDLVLACCGELNTRREEAAAWPALYGVAVDVRSGDLFPATFPDRGPDLPLRTARILTGKQDVAQVLEIYDSALGMLRIGPFNYEPVRGVDLWLEQSDEFILQHLSTSPLVEPPHYVSQMRQTLKYIQDNQFPAVTVFRDNRPHYYRRDEHTGGWQPVRY